MAFVLIRDGKRIERHREGARMLAEILTDREYQRVQEGSLVALTEGGGLMSLDSPLAEGQTIVLRPLQPEKDLAGFGFPINRAGDVVGISEMLAIRRHEERHAQDLYELPLDEIRRRVRGSERAAPIHPLHRTTRAEADRALGTLLADLATHGEADKAAEQLRYVELGARDRALDALTSALRERAEDGLALAMALLRVLGGIGNSARVQDPPTPEDQRWAAKAARLLAPSSAAIMEQSARLDVTVVVTRRIKAPPWAPRVRAPACV